MTRLFLLILTLTALTATNIYAGDLNIVETDADDFVLVGFFDLRDRESFIQITNTEANPSPVHIQIFNVADNCNENNFFDVYTGNDTHVYNLRDIQTNDGNPSGVVLPSDAYGIFIAYFVDELGIGNLRIEDANGYEYRTNLNGVGEIQRDSNTNDFTFNFNTQNGVTLSDIIGIGLEDISNTPEVFAADIVNIWISFDIDIYDLNEVPFSCRNVIFACTDQDNPLLPALLEESGEASVASLEYGINEAIPSSKGAPLLCPNNVVSEGFVRLDTITYRLDDTFVLFTGLNNGNGRGSIDVMWQDNTEISVLPE